MPYGFQGMANTRGNARRNEEGNDEQEVPLVNIPKPKKKSGKFVFIASGALVVSLLLAGTFMFVSSVLEDDGVVNNPNLITPSNNVLTPPPNSQLEELSKNNTSIKVIFINLDIFN